MKKTLKIGSHQKVYDAFDRIATAAMMIRGTMVIRPYDASRPWAIAVDDIAFPGFGNKLPQRVSHHMNGSAVKLLYVACHKPDPLQIQQAAYATKVLRMDRHVYTGKLIDVFRSKGKLYILLAGVLERDRPALPTGKRLLKVPKKAMVNYRMFNLDDGQLQAAQIDEVSTKGAKVAPCFA